MKVLTFQEIGPVIYRVSAETFRQVDAEEFSKTLRVTQETKENLINTTSASSNS